MTTPAETVEPVEELPEQRYTYQPKDDNGRPLGRPQVIKYRTQEELVQKLTHQNELVIRQLREVNKKNRLGILEKEEIPETAPRFSEPVEFKPQELTADERLLLARDLTDPEKMGAAFARLTTATFGAPPEKIREAIAHTQQSMTDAQIRQEVALFLNSTPEYYACKENFDTIYNWMMRYNLEPTLKNFRLAFSRLSDVLLQSGGTSESDQNAPEGTPVPAAVVTEGPDTYVQPAPAPAPPPAAPEQVQSPIHRINTGLSGMGTSSGGGPQVQPGNEITYTIPAVVEKTQGGGTIVRRQSVTVTGLKAIDAMPPEEYKHRFNTEPGFKSKVDALEKTRKWNPNQR